MKYLLILLFISSQSFAQTPDTTFCKKLDGLITEQMIEKKASYFATLEFSINPIIIHKAIGEGDLKYFANVVKNTKWVDYTPNTKYTIDFLISFQCVTVWIAHGNMNNWKGVTRLCNK